MTLIENLNRARELAGMAPLSEAQVLSLENKAPKKPIEDIKLSGDEVLVLLNHQEPSSSDRPAIITKGYVLPKAALGKIETMGFEKDGKRFIANSFNKEKMKEFLKSNAVRTVDVAAKYHNDDSVFVLSNKLEGTMVGVVSYLWENAA